MLKSQVADFENELYNKGEVYALMSSVAALDDINFGVGLSVNLPDARMREVISAGGKHMGLVDLTADTRKTVFKVLHEGRSRGDGPLDIARKLKEVVPKGRFKSEGARARTIARTETKYAQNVSTTAVYKESGVVTGLRVFDAQIGDTDEECEERHDEVITFADGEALTQAEHPNGTLSFAPEIDVEGLKRKRLEQRQAAAEVGDPILASSSLGGDDLLAGLTKTANEAKENLKVSHYDKDGYINDLGVPSIFHYLKNPNVVANMKKNANAGKPFSGLEKQAMDDLYKHSTILKEDTVLFKGFGQKTLVKKGDTFDVDLPTNYTYNPTNALDGDTFVELRLKAGARGVITDADSDTFVMMPGQRIKVLDVKDVNIANPLTGSAKLRRHVVATLDDAPPPSPKITSLTAEQSKLLSARQASADRQLKLFNEALLKFETNPTLTNYTALVKRRKGVSSGFSNLRKTQRELGIDETPTPKLPKNPPKPDIDLSTEDIRLIANSEGQNDFATLFGDGVFDHRYYSDYRNQVHYVENSFELNPALKRYTGTAYEDINTALRKQNKAELVKWRDDIDAVNDLATPIPDNLPLIRGVDRRFEQDVGDIVQDLGFASSSREGDVALAFGRGGYSRDYPLDNPVTMMEIVNVKGTNAIVTNPAELETIFRSGQEFRVLKRELNKVLKGSGARDGRSDYVADIYLTITPIK